MENETSILQEKVEKIYSILEPVLEIANPDQRCPLKFKIDQSGEIEGVYYLYITEKQICVGCADVYDQMLYCKAIENIKDVELIELVLSKLPLFLESARDSLVIPLAQLQRNFDIILKVQEIFGKPSDMQEEELKGMILALNSSGFTAMKYI